jgi:hypothetical protein
MAAINLGRLELTEDEKKDLGELAKGFPAGWTIAFIPDRFSDVVITDDKGVERARGKFEYGRFDHAIAYLKAALELHLTRS